MPSLVFTSHSPPPLRLSFLTPTQPTALHHTTHERPNKTKRTLCSSRTNPYRYSGYRIIYILVGSFAHLLTGPDGFTEAMSTAPLAACSAAAARSAADAARAAPAAPAAARAAAFAALSAAASASYNRAHTHTWFTVWLALL